MTRNRLVRYHLRFSSADKKILEKRAAKFGRTLADELREAIRHYVDSLVKEEAQ